KPPKKWLGKAGTRRCKGDFASERCRSFAGIVMYIGIQQRFRRGSGRKCRRENAESPDVARRPACARGTPKPRLVPAKGRPRRRQPACAPEKHLLGTDTEKTRTLQAASCGTARRCGGAWLCAPVWGAAAGRNAFRQ